MKPLQNELKESFDKYFNENDDIINYNNRLEYKRRLNTQHYNRTKIQNYAKNAALGEKRVKEVRKLYSRRRNGGTKGVIFKNKVITGARVIKGKVQRLSESYNPALNSFLMYKDYSNIYLCSDVHFFKNEIKKNKGMTTKELMKNFKTECDKLGPDDVLIYLGDISHKECTPEQHKQIQEFLKNCNCNKILIRGNHDKLDKNYYKKCGFIFIEDNIIYENIIFSHFPEDINKYRLEGIRYNIHGHLHGVNNDYYVDSSNHYDVWTPNHNFIRLDKIINLLRKKDRI